MVGVNGETTMTTCLTARSAAGRRRRTRRTNGPDLEAAAHIARIVTTGKGMTDSGVETTMIESAMMAGVDVAENATQMTVVVAREARGSMCQLWGALLVLRCVHGPAQTSLEVLSTMPIGKYWWFLRRSNTLFKQTKKVHVHHANSIHSMTDNESHAFQIRRSWSFVPNNFSSSGVYTNTHCYPSNLKYLRVSCPQSTHLKSPISKAIPKAWPQQTKSSSTSIARAGRISLKS